jgi:hypothetical protein
MMSILNRRALAAALTSLAMLAPLANADAQSGASEASALSALPIAVSVAAPVMIVTGGAVLTVVAVEASADGTVWVLQRASDGALASVQLSARATGGLSVAVGTVVTVAAISTGWVLSAAGQAIAFIPNQVGAALLYNERVTR